VQKTREGEKIARAELSAAADSDSDAYAKDDVLIESNRQPQAGNPNCAIVNQAEMRVARHRHLHNHQLGPYRQHVHAKNG
jgi:hypothetical protein